MGTRSLTPLSKCIQAGAVLAAILVTCPGQLEAREWKVENKLEGKPDKDDPNEIHKAQDVSGIACSSETGFPRQCIVIDDEAQRAQVVIVHDNKLVAGQSFQLISNSHNGKPVELDGEGVAYADGYFYIIGSHGSPRSEQDDKAKREARIAASSQLVRFRIDSDDVTKDGRLKVSPRIEATSKLRKALANNPILQPFAEKDLDKNGLTIEGAAVKGGTLYAGLRAPGLLGAQTVVASVTVTSLFDGKPTIPEVSLHYLTVGEGNGIRDLAVYKGQFIVLVGPALDLKEDDPGKYFISRWAGQGDLSGPRTEVEVHRGKPGDDKSKYPKPEAILPLDESNDGLRVLVIYEGAKEGRPREVTIR
jgi:hypothetical protein